MKEKWKKGSFTVEAAALMGVILFVLMGILYLFFHVHNRAWLTAAAYEAALDGSMAAVTADEEAYPVAWYKARQLGNIGFTGGRNLSLSVDTGSQVTVSYHMDTQSDFWNFLWHMNLSAQEPILHPIRWIRQVKAGAEVLALR